MLVNSLRLKSSATLEWASKHLWGTIYLTVDGTSVHSSIKLRNKISVSLDSLAFQICESLQTMRYSVKYSDPLWPSQTNIFSLAKF